MDIFRFQSPWFFLLLLPLVILVFVQEYRRKPVNVLFSDVSRLRLLPKTFAQRFSVFVPYFLYAAIGLFITASARPQFGKEDYRIRTEGIALVMCVDRSGSMAAVDFDIDGQRVNRLEAVKKTFRDFVAGNGTLPGRKDDKIGLLAFGGYVDSFCPLTLDHSTLLEMLKQVSLPKAVVDAQGRLVDQKLYDEENMTAIGDALAQGVERLKDSQAKSRVIILLSDGEQTFGVLTPLEGAETAKTFGIRIYCIGIGTTGTVPVVATDLFGRRQIVQQYMTIDEEMLRKVAELTGGLYFNARNTQALENIYAEIDKLEKTENEGRTYTQYTELFRKPLNAGTVLLLLYVFCICTKFRRLP